MMLWQIIGVKLEYFPMALLGWCAEGDSSFPVQSPTLTDAGGMLL